MITDARAEAEAALREPRMNGGRESRLEAALRALLIVSQPADSTEAQLEAERRWPAPMPHPTSPLEWHDLGMGSGFVLGAQWQAERPAATTADRSEVRMWGLSEEQVRVLWQLARDWDSRYDGPRFDGIATRPNPYRAALTTEEPETEGEMR